MTNARFIPNSRWFLQYTASMRFRKREARFSNEQFSECENPSSGNPRISQAGLRKRISFCRIPNENRRKTLLTACQCQACGYNNKERGNYAALSCLLSPVPPHMLTNQAGSLPMSRIFLCAACLRTGSGRRCRSLPPGNASPGIRRNPEQKN